MKCDCDHPRNDDGLHTSDCALLAFNEAVERATEEAVRDLRDELRVFMARTKLAIRGLGGKWPKGDVE